MLLTDKTSIVSVTETPAWRALEAHYREIRSVHLRDLFPAWELVQAFLSAEFSREERHVRRLAKVSARERALC